MTDDALAAALLEIERHVGHGGWDQPARLFALVPTAELLAAEPSLAEQITNPDDLPEGALSSIEQDGFNTSGLDVLDALAGIGWPESVFGCAVALERLFVPPHVEEQIPQDAAAAEDFVARLGLLDPHDSWPRGAVPATIAILGGRLKAGLSKEEITYLGKSGRKVAKVSRRDLPVICARGIAHPKAEGRPFRWKERPAVGL